MIEVSEGLAPEQDFEVEAGSGASTLIIACGALAREIVTVVRASGFPHFAITCLPAILHNRPERITPAVRAKIKANRGRFDRILCLYGDCGTGGELDRMLAEEDVERIDGAHCYAFLAGPRVFDDLAAQDLGTFYLTDYLARHFDRLVIAGLGLDRHPELRDLYFGRYTRVLYLAQTDDPDLHARAQAAAARLGLAFGQHSTGLAGLAQFIGSKRPDAQIEG